MEMGRLGLPLVAQAACTSAMMASGAVGPLHVLCRDNFDQFRAQKRVREVPTTAGGTQAPTSR
jgi:hypothetical protein